MRLSLGPRDCSLQANTIISNLESAMVKNIQSAILKEADKFFVTKWCFLLPNFTALMVASAKDYSMGITLVESGSFVAGLGFDKGCMGWMVMLQ